MFGKIAALGRVWESLEYSINHREASGTFFSIWELIKIFREVSGTYFGSLVIWELIRSHLGDVWEDCGVGTCLGVVGSHREALGTCLGV
jgi:hypothetical protein